MRFTLEAVFAKHGDAMILHFGPKDDPRWVLIDGGPPGVYRSFLRPRLDQLREAWNFGPRESLPLEMVMVSHVDSDHVAGVLDLFDDQCEALDGQQPLPFDVRTLWHNSFDDILDNEGEEIVSRLADELLVPGGLEASPMSRPAGAVVASVKQGRNLRRAAHKLGMDVNAPFQGLVMAPATHRISLAHGLQLTVIGPLREQVEEFQEAWREELPAILAGERAAARAAAFEDDSPFNLASLVVVAELEGKRMLLTGDARGDHVVQGLEAVGLKQPGVPVHFDVLKVPHHGSERNVTQGFFEAVTADVYLISGNGSHGNPEPKMLTMLAKARAGARYELRMTFTRNSSRNEDNAKRAKAMRRVERWIKKRRPRNCSVKHRHRRSRAKSVHVDLGDVELDY